MFVCICKALTEKTIAQRIEAGATSVEAVRAAFSLYDDDCCGGCEPMIEELCEEVCDRMTAASCPIAEAKRAGSFGSAGLRREAEAGLLH